MRVGIFTDAYSPSISGVVTSIKMLEKGLTAAGHEVFIITTSYKHNREGKVDHVLRIKGINLPLKALSGYQLVRKAGRYFNQVKALNLDVIHIHTEFSIGRFGVHAAEKLNIPLIYTTHTMYEDYMHHIFKFCKRIIRKPYMNYVSRILNWLVSASTYVIAPNQKVIDMYERYKIKKDFKLIPTGLELDRFSKERYSKEEVYELKKSLGIENDLVILNIGRVAKEKSLDLIINEFSHDSIRNMAKLVIVGDGPERKNLEKLVKEKHLQGRVVFAGSVPYDKIGIYYQIGDIFVNASVTETQGLTYIEALAASLPIIVRYDTNLEEFVKNDFNGVFYHTQEELGQALKKVVFDHEYRKTLTDNAPKSIVQYSVLHYCENVLKLYKDGIELFKEKGIYKVTKQD